MSEVFSPEPSKGCHRSLASRPTPNQLSKSSSVLRLEPCRCVCATNAVTGSRQPMAGLCEAGPAQLYQVPTGCHSSVTAALTRAGTMTSFLPKEKLRPKEKKGFVLSHSARRGQHQAEFTPHICPHSPAQSSPVTLGQEIDLSMPSEEDVSESRGWIGAV